MYNFSPTLRLLLPTLLILSATPSSAVPWLPSHQSVIKNPDSSSDSSYVEQILPYWSISLYNISMCLPPSSSPASSAGFLNYAGTSSLPCAPILDDAAYPLPSYYFTTTETGDARFKVLFWLSEDCGLGRKFAGIEMEEPAWDTGSNWNGCFGPVGMAKARVKGFSIEMMKWDEALSHEVPVN
jgi:hypothetical protein